MSTTSKAPRPPKGARGGSVFGDGFDSATAPVAPPPTAAAGQPTAAAAAQEQQPAPTAATQEQQPAPGPARDLAAYLGVSHQGDGADFLSAMLAGPPLDPMLDLVQLGAKIPRHYAEALRLKAVAQRRHKQQLVIEALAAYLGDELLAKSLAAQQGRR